MKRKQRKRKPRQKYRKRTQTVGFLNRHDFIYAGRDTVNQVGKIAPRIKKKHNQRNKGLGSTEYKPNYQPGWQRSGEGASQNSWRGH